MYNAAIRPHWLVACCSAATTAAVMPALIRRLRKVGRVDIPNARSSHDEPTPRGGGMACAAGVASGLLVAKAVGSPAPASLTSGVAFLSLVGYLDDRFDLPPAVRLGAQVMTGAVMGRALGGGIGGAVCGALLQPAIVNSFNFMDGINGISGGQISVWAVSALPALLKIDAYGEIVLASSALGAGLAFLPWNLPTAKVFLGDSGSYLFGSIIAAVCLSAAHVDRRVAIHLLSPYLIYFADTGATLLRRIAAGQRVMQPHREHIYQQLVDYPGVQHWHVALVVNGLSAVSGAIARWRGRRVVQPVLVSAYLGLPAVVRRRR